MPQSESTPQEVLFTIQQWNPSIAQYQITAHLPTGWIVKTSEEISGTASLSMTLPMGIHGISFKDILDGETDGYTLTIDYLNPQVSSVQPTQQMEFSASQVEIGQTLVVTNTISCPNQGFCGDWRVDFGDGSDPITKSVPLTHTSVLTMSHAYFGVLNTNVSSQLRFKVGVVINYSNTQVRVVDPPTPTPLSTATISTTATVTPTAESSATPSITPTVGTVTTTPVTQTATPDTTATSTPISGTLTPETATPSSTAGTEEPTLSPTVLPTDTPGTPVPTEVEPGLWNIYFPYMAKGWVPPAP
jgi:hypothetical protein